MVSRRPPRAFPGAARGHSLPELLVALTLLAASLGSVGAAGVVGSQRTARSTRATEAMLAAVAVLDSITALPVSPPASGSAQRGGWRVEWASSAGGVEAGISAVGEDAALLRLHLSWPDAPPPPELPEP